MTELTDIQEYLKQGWANDIGSQIQYLTDLSIYKARVNELKVEAEKAYLNKLAIFQNVTDVSKMKQFEYRDIKDVYCKDEILNKLTCDTVSGTIETQHRALITIISHAKAEMQMIN